MGQIDMMQITLISNVPIAPLNHGSSFFAVLYLMLRKNELRKTGIGSEHFL